MSMKFKSVSLDIKQPLLDEIIDAYLCEERPTRKSVAEASGASLASVGKVMSALVECKLAYEVSRPQKDGGKPCLHQSLNDSLLTLVLDLSSPDFKMSVFNGTFDCLQLESHIYDSTVNRLDNLTVFLSRGAKNLDQMRKQISAISVILADPKLADLTYGGMPIPPILPTIEDTPTIDTHIMRIFGTVPMRYIYLSEAFSSALRYRTLPGSENINHAVCIHIGSQLYAIVIDENTRPLLCRLSDLLVEGTQLASEVYHNAVTSGYLDSLLLRAVNFLTCITDANTYIIETEHVRFASDMLRSVKQAFALIGKPAPEVIARRDSQRIAVLGAARHAVATLLKSHLCKIDH